MPVNREARSKKLSINELKAMKKLLLTFMGLLGQLRLDQCYPSPNEHSYVVANDQLMPMEGESETLFIFSNLEIIGRQRFVNGSLIIVEDMDDDNFGFTVQMFTSPHGDGVYKKMAMDVPKIEICAGFTKFYKEFVQPSFTYGENSNIPFIDEDGLCPIPAGEYYLKNIQFNTDVWPSEMPRGTLKIIVTFFKADAMIGGLTAFLKIEDRTR